MQGTQMLWVPLPAPRAAVELGGRNFYYVQTKHTQTRKPVSITAWEARCFHLHSLLEMTTQTPSGRCPARGGLPSEGSHTDIQGACLQDTSSVELLWGVCMCLWSFGYFQKVPPPPPQIAFVGMGPGQMPDVAEAGKYPRRTGRPREAALIRTRGWQRRCSLLPFTVRRLDFEPW